MMGGLKLFRLVLCTDLVLGPLISLIIFSPQKSRTQLVADYSIVGMMQFAALVYGVSIIIASRPVFIVFVVDRFEVVTAAELSDGDIVESTNPKYRSLSWFGPVLVGAQFPVDVIERNKLLFSSVAGKDIQLMPKYYVPYEKVIDLAQKKSKQFQFLIDSHPEVKQNLIAKFGDLKDLGNLHWLPVRQRYGFWTVLIDKNGYPIEYLPIDPY